MHNIKDIRKDFALFAKSLEKRSLKLILKIYKNLMNKIDNLFKKKKH
jgi:hypothetical protein